MIFPNLSTGEPIIRKNKFSRNNIFHFLILNISILIRSIYNVALSFFPRLYQDSRIPTHP